MRKLYFKKTYKIIIVLFLLYFQCVTSFSQLSTSQIKNVFGLQNDTYLKESVFLHIDRSEYVAGENIWFKVYYALNNRFCTSSLSQLVYLDIVDDNGRSVARAKYKIKNGFADGAFTLPTDILSGYYTIFAYTRWMKNFGPEQFFRKKIYIVNPEKGLKVISSNGLDNDSIKLEFYPNGGFINFGFKNKIYVKATNFIGENISIKGKITDQNDNFITNFFVPASNFGQFELSPDKNCHYKAIVDKKVNNKESFQLPQVYDNGISLSIINLESNGIEINIFLTDKNSQNKNGLDIILINGGIIYKQFKVDFLDEHYSTIIPRGDLMPGINALLIKDSKGNLLYQSIISNPIKSIQTEAFLDKKKYKTREKVNLKIKTEPEISGNQSYFSVSVAKSYELAENKNIINDFIDKKNGTSEFIQNDSLKYTDFVLSNEGLDSTLKINEINTLPETKGLIVSGQIRDNKSEKPIVFTNVYISTLNNYIEVQNDLTNQDGKFKFMLKGAASNTDFVIQVADNNLKDYKVILDKDFEERYIKNQMNYLVEGQYNKGFYEDLVHNYQIGSQFCVKDLENQIKPSVPTLFYGKADSSYLLQKFVEMPTLEDFFVEIVGNVIVRKTKTGFSLMVSNSGNSDILTSPPLLMVDGVPVFNLNEFISIPISEIEKVDVIKSYYILGEMKYGGVIQLFTKKNNFGSLLKKNKMNYFELIGISKDNRYAEVNYSDNTLIRNKIPDFRNTLYWNPLIVTNEQGEANISFYTSDEKGKFLITIEGISVDGVQVCKQLILETE